MRSMKTGEFSLIFVQLKRISNRPKELYKKHVLKKYLKIHKKARVMEYIFSKVAGIGLQLNFPKGFRTVVLNGYFWHCLPLLIQERYLDV